MFPARKAGPLDVKGRERERERERGKEAKKGDLTTRVFVVAHSARIRTKISHVCLGVAKLSLSVCAYTHVCVAGSCISGMEMEEEIRPGNGEEGGGGGEKAAWRHATKKGRTKHLRAPCVCIHAVLRQEKRKCANARGE